MKKKYGLQGVHAILTADPSVQGSVLELLLPHFELFVQAEGSPLRLDLCACIQVRHVCNAAASCTV